MHSFIFDAEVTGLSIHSDMIIEIALLQCILSNEVYKPGRYYRRVFSYHLPPDSDFARRNHAPLYDECANAPSVAVSVVRESILEYFEACGSTEPKERTIIGSRLTDKLYQMNFCRYLIAPEVVEFTAGTQEVGDYKEILDLYMLRGFFSNTFRENPKYIEEQAAKLQTEMPLPPGKKHQALYDCFRYLNEVNKYRLFLMAPWEILL